jgi:hypothetical protein
MKLNDFRKDRKMALIQMGSVDEAVTALIVSILSVNTEGGFSRGGD